jgi:ATP-dependent Lon protease
MSKKEAKKKKENDDFEIIDDLNAGADYFPLLSIEAEQMMNQETFPSILPILPLRNNVLFPGVVIPITVGRESSLKLVRQAEKGNRTIGVLTQMNAEDEVPTAENLYSIGTVAYILRVLHMPDESTTLIIQGKRRFSMEGVVANAPYISAETKILKEKAVPKAKMDTYKLTIEAIKKLALQIIHDNPNIPNDASMAVESIDSPTFLMNFIASNLDALSNKKQAILEESDLLEKARLLFESLNVEAQMVQMRGEIQQKARVDMDKQQREYFLQQQIRTIKDELGDDPLENDLLNMEDRAKLKLWSPKVEKIFNKELERFQRMNPQSSEYSVQHNYLDMLLDLPWNEFTEDKLDINKAGKVLDRDHFGLEKVKERILEYLAVLKLKGDMKSPILCFYGPPGVGKTSLGKSIAEALGRKYVRMSLGGVHDESEVRGHRKTYIGAMPGRIIQNLKKAGSSNPVFILDEIDKLGKSNHGDPSSALLEVLDPEQNNEFYDNFVETEYDLSRVMFIATANNLSSIPGPLRDRMEIIEVSGYTMEEKVEIGKNHLFQKQLNAHGITTKDLSIGKKELELLVDKYTSESGVRSLDKAIAKLVRNRAKDIAMENEFTKAMSKEHIEKIMGPGRDRSKYDNNNVAGVVTGLAWTSVGGEILFIESSITKGKGKLTLTGNLGNVMKESAVIAMEYLKAHSSWIGLEQSVFDEHNVHVHVPEGATPKDGPSAGITMLTSLASLFSQRKVKKNLAMTGEITLRGDVLPVGGIKEKILAAKRATIKEIILCESNRKDIDEIPEHYLKGLSFHYVKTMREVLDIALTKELVEHPISMMSIAEKTKTEISQN